MRAMPVSVERIVARTGFRLPPDTERVGSKCPPYKNPKFVKTPFWRCLQRNLQIQFI